MALMGTIRHDDWLTLEESNWLIREALDNEVTGNKGDVWKEEDFLEGFYDDDVDDDDDDDDDDACNEDEDEEDGKDEDAK